MRKGRKRGVEKERGEIYRGERGGRGTGGGERIFSKHLTNTTNLNVKTITENLSEDNHK